MMCGVRTRPHGGRRLTASALLCTLVATLAGCASFSDDGGLNAVSEWTATRTGVQPRFGDADSAQGRVADLLAQPLSADAAVEVALLNHRGLRASLAQLRIAEADLVRAGRMANPTLSFGRLQGGGHIEIERSVMFNILGLLTLPLAHDLEQQRFEQVQLQAALDAVTLATDARSAFFEAVAAQQLLGYQQQVIDAADAASELAKRMAAVGNISELARLREQAFRADATAQQSRAQQGALAARERLTRLLGLSAAQASYTLPERLPDLPAAPTTLQAAEQTALTQRLDVRLATREAESTARALGLTQATGFINVLHAGYQNASGTGEPRSNGYEIELELPIFDFGQSRQARAEAIYMQAVHRASQTATDAQSQVRESYAAYQSAYALARHYRDEVVPLRRRIGEETLLRYNGMLIGVFELLVDAREQIGAVTASIDALRELWVADARLQMALTGGPPGAAVGGTTPAPAAAAAAAASH